MNICFYTHAVPDPIIGGVERVTYNLAAYFKKMGHTVFNLVKYGEDKSMVIPSDGDTASKINFINAFLQKNNVEILIDQYGALSYLTHPYIPHYVKIITCVHLSPINKYLLRSLLETFSFKTLKYSLLNIAFALNIPRRKLLNKRKMRNLLRGGGG